MPVKVKCQGNGAFPCLVCGKGTHELRFPAVVCLSAQELYRTPGQQSTPLIWDLGVMLSHSPFCEESSKGPGFGQVEGREVGWKQNPLSLMIIL